jgi:hypothetical protein
VRPHGFQRCTATVEVLRDEVEFKERMRNDLVGTWAVVFVNK